jgi:hypothetical protein
MPKDVMGYTHFKMKGENWLQVFLDEQYVNKVVLRLLNMVSR